MLSVFSAVSFIHCRLLPRPLSSVIRATMSSYFATEYGTRNTQDFRVFFSSASGPVSPFHDIPLRPSPNELHMVVEIPRWTNAKMEICKEEPLNPIKQDIKKGKLRYVDNVFPYHGYIWNYGAFPQTWEDPNHKDVETGCGGDNDPLDVCEIGSKIHSRGSVIRVKPLGILALIDEGETDWKILAIDVSDPMAEKLNDLSDIDTHMPGFLDATRSWFKLYKVPQGKPFNQFAFNGEFKNREFAEKVIDQTNQQWKRLVGKVVDGGDICCENVSVAGSPFLIARDDAKSVVTKLSAVSDGVKDPDSTTTEEKWHFISDN